MKKILLSSVALLGFSVGAMAADLPARRMAPAPIIAVPVFTWTGFYVGVNAGVGFGTDNNDNGSYAYNPFFPTFGYGYGYGNDDNDTAFIGGAQAGFNFQTGMFVFGVEADIQYAGFGNSNKNNGLYNPFFYGYGYGSNDDGNDGYFGTVRARVGVAFDRLLVFATGGLAYGDIGNNNNNGFGGFGGFNPLFPAFGAGYGYNNDDSNDIGYAVGGGIEYAITNNFTVKVEGLYVNLGDDNNNRGYGFNPLFPFAGNGNGGKNNAEFGVVRAGLNYKF